MDKKTIIFFLASLLIALIGFSFLSSQITDNIINENDLARYEEAISEPNPDSIYYQEFITPDGKIKFEYSSEWTRITDSNVLSGFYPQQDQIDYGFGLVFLAQSIKSKKFSQLNLTEGQFGEKSNLEGVLEIMKETNEKQGWDIEILSSELTDYGFTVEILYKKDGQVSLKSKERIIFLAEDEIKTYIVAFLSAEIDWTDLEERREKFLNSVEIVEDTKEI